MDPVAIPTTAAEFRAVAPSFSDTSMFPDDAITFWLMIATAMTNADRWGDMTGLGVILFAEHNLALEAMAQAQDNAGGIPGISRGVVSSESAKSVSVSYDTAIATVPDAGHWNLTTFGTRLVYFMSLFGAGPIQVNIGPGGMYGFFSWNPDACFGQVGPGWGR